VSRLLLEDYTFLQRITCRGRWGQGWWGHGPSAPR